jgi:microcystin-dependent protein
MNEHCISDRRKVMKKAIILVSLLIVAGLVQAQSVPSFVDYQGRLTDAGGAPLGTDDYALRFEVYDDPIAGSRVWGPLCFDLETGETLSAGHKFKVPVVQGYFNVVLDQDNGYTDCSDTTPDGNGVPAPVSTAFAGAQRYVEVAVWNETAWEPILPRQQVLSAPFAVSALNGVPPGSILPYGGSGLPPGDWLLCDGSAVSRTDYAALFEAIADAWGAGDGSTTFNLPDLMTEGRFVRGGTPGVLQDDSTAVPNSAFVTGAGEGIHMHYWRGWRASGSGSRAVRSKDRIDSDGLDDITMGDDGQHVHTIGGGDSETRPVSAAVRWIIKY